MTFFNARFSNIVADDLSEIKIELERIGFKITDIKPTNTQSEWRDDADFFFAINAEYIFDEKKEKIYKLRSKRS